MLQKKVKMNKTIHFEDLWERAEKVSVLELRDEKESLARISAIIAEIRDIYIVSANASDKSLVKGIQSKAIGRLLFALTALSGKEDVDVYAALKDQLDVLELKEKINFSL